MGKSNRAYKSAKRSREVARLKKQQEKRKKRLEKDPDLPENEATGADSSEDNES